RAAAAPGPGPVATAVTPPSHLRGATPGPGPVTAAVTPPSRQVSETCHSSAQDVPIPLQQPPRVAVLPETVRVTERQRPGHRPTLLRGTLFTCTASNERGRSHGAARCAVRNDRSRSNVRFRG